MDKTKQWNCDGGSPEADLTKRLTDICTCHPDDDPPKPCPQKFAYKDCMKAALAAARQEERERCAQIADQYADNPPSGPHNNTQEAFDLGMNHQAGATDCALCIRDAIREAK